METVLGVLAGVRAGRNYGWARVKCGAMEYSEGQDECDKKCLPRVKVSDVLCHGSGATCPKSVRFVATEGGRKEGALYPAMHGVRSSTFSLPNPPTPTTTTTTPTSTNERRTRKQVYTPARTRTSHQGLQEGLVVVVVELHAHYLPTHLSPPAASQHSLPPPFSLISRRPHITLPLPMPTSTPKLPIPPHTYTFTPYTPSLPPSPLNISPRPPPDHKISPANWGVWGVTTLHCLPYAILAPTGTHLIPVFRQRPSYPNNILLQRQQPHVRPVE
ncbi:hypothetical protein Pmani_005734 [Petrolisthes manimaculis]|uniref:Uncharacterized protein n=1 Tax=Petrolisthes manimaculis TaxID=1843537 RepID=A0AAE1QC45_9EUCA|nr:hypothetical protein Pmani_005734 [Petrolisthes manimaculis]